MKDRSFVLAILLAIAQQALLAFSTYFIAMAGATLSDGDLTLVLRYISFFFGFALSAYIVSSLSSIYVTKASNSIWLKYTKSALREASSDMQYASEKNKKSLVQWVSGEAGSTITHACGFYVGLVSTCLNIIMTLAVFYLSIGLEITIAISISLLISATLVAFLKNRIKKIAGDMQQKRLDALLSIELTWDSATLGSLRMKSESFESLDTKTRSYFGEVDRYVLLEQAIACLPIALATIVVAATIHTAGIITAASVGALVAMLPRSLQVFGSIHSLSIYFSQFLLVRAKMKNLHSFVSKLDKHDRLSSMNLDHIKIEEHHSSYAVKPCELLDQLKNGSITVGRYLLSGSNGSGKSSYLKKIKAAAKDSILMTPEAQFINLDNNLSTGELRLLQIEKALCSPPPIVMLDEWDANLDLDNVSRFNAILDSAAKKIVVIESRHKR
ncbi:ABC transporter ATP-binding protein [Pseudomonas sp. SID14000]|uniref:ATP-binding cassette domain-containing protein n=1 Tax=Pseudomonas sp. SID14000 TaxID=1986221 RepID=UPI002113C21D|nr:ABC transporter ATP-binding protein [Pseudomonas sp. SID14000]